MAQLRALIAGLASLAALFFLVVGVPVALVEEVGTPLPSGGLSLQGETVVGFVRHLLGSPIPFSFWAKALGALAWLLWGWLCVGLLSGLLARRSGRRAQGLSERLTAGMVARVLVAAGIVYAALLDAHPAGASERPVTSAAVSSVSSSAGPTGSVVCFGLGASSAAVVATIDRLRKVQQRHRTSGTTIAMPPMELASAELSLRAGMEVEQSLVERLLETARDTTPVSLPAVALRGRRDLPPDSEVEIEVAVLGPVEVRGAAREFSRSRSLDLVVYLAMHPGGVERDVWVESMWPGRLTPASTVDSTVSVARRALGQSSDGSLHLPTRQGRLALGPKVSTDWERFVALTSPRAQASPQALELVRGRLFEGLRRSEWVVCEGIGPAMESWVADVAVATSEQLLEAGDLAGSTWAARQGLAVSPYDERLYRLLMRAADAAGSRAGVVAAMEELRAVVADDLEPFDGVHPATESLFRSLLGLEPPVPSSRVA